MARKSEIVEVKHSQDLKKNAKKYKAKFAAATAFAEKEGKTFRRVTEKDIRIPRLKVLNYLNRYRREQCTPEQIATVFAAIQHLHGRAPLRAVLDALSDDAYAQAQWINVVLHLVSKKQLLMDYDNPIDSNNPITYDTEIWMAA